MRVPRFIIRPSENNQSNQELVLGQQIYLPPEETHHLKKVLRLSQDDVVEIFHETSERSFLCTITNLGGEQAELLLTKNVDREASPRTHLLMGLIKTDLCDYIVEKAVEIGISSITFYGGDRSQEKLRGSDKQEKRLSRWHRIAGSALKQSGAPKLPALSLEKKLVDVFRSKHFNSCQAQDDERRLILLAPLHPSHPQFRQVPKITEYFQRTVRSLSAETTPLEKVSKPVDSYILIGPEGGFTEEELRLATDYGYAPASLGSNVLRAETAVVAALTIVALLEQN